MVLGTRRMEGWSGNLHSGDCEMEARQSLSQRVPGSSLFDAEVMECTCPPWWRKEGSKRVSNFTL